jgi:hypothetical protein
MRGEADEADDGDDGDGGDDSAGGAGSRVDPPYFLFRYMISLVFE